MFTRWRVVFVLVACVGAACANEDDGEQTLPLPGNVEVAAQQILRHTLAYHSAATSIFARVKGELEANRFALVDELQRKIEESRYVVGGDLENVAEELLDHMQGARDDVKLVAEVYHLVHRYIDLMRDPRRFESEPDDDQYLWDSIDQYSALKTIVDSPVPESSERAYYLAPAFNFVLTTRFVLEASTRGADDGKGEIAEMIKTNRAAVGTGKGKGDDLGTLSTYVTARYAGDASAREKNDADPVVYSIRRMLAEQEAALE